MNFYQQKYFQPYQKTKNTQTLHPVYPYEITTYSGPNGQSFDLKRIDLFQEECRSDDQNEEYEAKERNQNETIWQHLYEAGLQSKSYIQKLHRSNRYKIDRECTFQPLINYSNRFLNQDKSSFLQRTTIWKINKIEKQVKLRTEGVFNELKQCTFTPALNQRCKRYKVSIQEKLYNKRDDRFSKDMVSASQTDKFKQTKNGKENIAKNIGRIKDLIRTELKLLEL